MSSRSTAHPAPDRPTTWRAFLRWNRFQVVATDFFTVEAWTGRGLRTYYVLFFLDLQRRRVHFAGMTPDSDDHFMAGAARGLHRFLKGKRFLHCDRDKKYSRGFAELSPAGVHILRTRFQAPYANAHADRFVRSIKSECLDRMIWFEEQPLCCSIFEYLEHYHRERNHQGLENELIAPWPTRGHGKVVCRQRLGELQKQYERAA